MSQRDSGYARKERDLYETPGWVTLALVPYIKDRVPQPRLIWEPASGSNKMVYALRDGGYEVYATDIVDGCNFLAYSKRAQNTDAIITNPPYEFAQEFISQALALMKPCAGFVAMLLRTDFDHAKTRANLFAGCMPFAKKVVLTKRIKWFEDSKGQPSFNHAWFIWDWQHSGPPTLAYGP